jgi:signal transduction histidine kinase
MVAGLIEPIVRSHNAVYLATNLTGAPFLLLLAWRRTRPLLVITVFCAGAIAASIVQGWLIPHQPSDVFIPIFALLIAIYSVGAHASRRDVLLAAPQPLIVMLVADATQPHSDSLASAIAFFSVFIIAVPIAAGRLVRGRTRLIAQLQQQALELDEQRTAYVHAARGRERLRVTEDLHRSLAIGMQDLLQAVDDRAEVGDVETRARQLLAATREAVVTLADNAAPGQPEPPPTVVSTTPADLSDAAQPWTAIAAAALAGGLLVEVRDLPLHVPAAVGAAAGILLALPLAFAWARPLLAVACVWVAAVVFTHAVTPLRHTTSAAALSFVLPFVIAALEPRRRALIGLGLCWVGILATFGAGALPGDATIAAACWLAGAGFQQRARLVTELHANNLLLEQGRVSLAAQAVDEERMRLARELHDAVGHSLTVVALQAGAARRIWDTDRPKALEMLETVRTVARAGLAELRDGLTTGAGTSLAELINRARASGLQLHTGIDDDALAAAAPQQLATMYRVVQEGLTNALKHSPGGIVTINIHSVDGDVEVSISNTAPTSAVVAAQPSGRGLIGMRARVEECGGRLHHHPTGDGGFVVRARLPLATVPA